MLGGVRAGEVGEEGGREEEELVGGEREVPRRGVRRARRRGGRRLVTLGWTRWPQVAGWRHLVRGGGRVGLLHLQVGVDRQRALLLQAPGHLRLLRGGRRGQVAGGLDLDAR